MSRFTILLGGDVRVTERLRKQVAGTRVIAADSGIRHVPLLGLFIGDGTHWLLLKMFLFLIVFLWLRATFPRYRYDQIMRLGWKVFIPVTLVWLVVVGLWMQSPFSIWK